MYYPAHTDINKTIVVSLQDFITDDEDDFHHVFHHCKKLLWTVYCATQSLVPKLNIWTIDEVQHIFAVIIGAGACTATADIANSTLGYFRGGVRSNAPGSIAPPVRCPHFIGLDTFAFIVQR